MPVDAAAIPTAASAQHPSDRASSQSEAIVNGRSIRSTPFEGAPGGGPSAAATAAGVASFDAVTEPATTRGGGEAGSGRAADADWWDAFFCCAAVPGGATWNPYRAGGYVDDSDSDASDDDEAAAAIGAGIQRCDVCGCLTCGLSRGCLVSLCCQEPKRSKSFDALSPTPDRPAPQTYVDPETP